MILGFMIHTLLFMIKPPSERLIAKVEMTKNRIFPLSIRSANLPQSIAHTISSIDEYWLWYYRFGHLPFKILNLLHKHSMVKGLPVIHEQSNTYEDCSTDKHQRDIFPTSTSRAKEHLELIHTDLCGLMQNQSIGGSFYFLTFIDDFKRKMWIYFLKKKSKTFSRLNELKCLIEKQYGKFIKEIRSYFGGEYDSHDFTDLCKQHGIER